MPPIYAYRVIEEDGEGEIFEIEQSLGSTPISEHPLTGKSVVRILDSPSLSLKHSEEKERRMLSADNLNKSGFSRYERDPGSGVYHQTAGKEGPKEINRED
ncbi:MAG: FmdB family transcriptional regulator [Verrucomicrobia bacterium]|nr:FmdB family transcriptional regulator [Verrucomicrobiota bacterium]MDA1048610.1 FmdB family transcriptional regulator [Verrucomicrobiota bacterium]